MRSEIEIREQLEAFLEQVLEPRVRRLMELGEIKAKVDLDDALHPLETLRGVIDEWEFDLKAELGYESMSATSGENPGEFSSPTERAAWLRQLCEQLEVTQEQLADMDLEDVLRRIREH